MNIILSFIGILPSYIIDCVYQIRLYTNNDIYLILNDYDSIYNKDLVDKYNVKLIKYEDVYDNEFIETMNSNIKSFWYLEWNKGRELLFVRSIERFYLVNKLITKYNLNHNLFMEIDILIYDDPDKWINGFSKKDIGYMSHSIDHSNSGIFYIKEKNSLNNLLDYMLNYVKIAKYKDCPNEMKALFEYYSNNPDNIQMFPLIFKNTNVPKITYENYDDYNNTIFDGAAAGIYLLGEDAIHNNGVIVYNKSFDHFFIKANNYKYKWDTIDGLKKPYIFNTETNEWILINNLHVHSKDLKNGLSK